MRRLVLASLAGWLVAGSSGSFAAESVSPYIDQLRSQMKTESAPAPTASEPDPYIESVRKKLETKEPTGAQGSYTEKLKQQLGPTPSAQSYTEQQKEKLEPEKTESAIEAVKEGHSEL